MSYQSLMLALSNYQMENFSLELLILRTNANNPKQFLLFVMEKNIDKSSFYKSFWSICIVGQKKTYAKTGEKKICEFQARRLVDKVLLSFLTK